ncbi:hypothetical protein BJ912DRAFT_673430 [Pholiota molesta]|nr:hypothetical protein BJ912DRAFT_673430 [Pholiota molesta]
MILHAPFADQQRRCAPLLPYSPALIQPPPFMSVLPLYPSIRLGCSFVVVELFLFRMMGRLVCGFFLFPLFVHLVYSVGLLLIYPRFTLPRFTLPRFTFFRIHFVCCLLPPFYLLWRRLYVTARAGACYPWVPRLSLLLHLSTARRGVHCFLSFWRAVFGGVLCKTFVVLCGRYVTATLFRRRLSIFIYYTARCVLVFSCDLGVVPCCVR